ncbi:MAG: FKBP-type peptidyl-prolyl cis-trans isomerase [Lentimicrobiaceae bacterium]|jgi:peptidylprolyl isomerase|nr:FKBP-type peptidyl-prolyl cis-trans isomerase [Lentimicrobiaceae bacterium]
MKILKLSVFAMAISMLAFACGDSDPFKDFEKAENGVNIKYHKRGAESAKPQVGDFAYFSMSYFVGDSMYFNSNDFAGERPFPVREPEFVGDMNAALSLLNIGDSVTIGILVDSMFIDPQGNLALPQGVEPGDPSYFNIQLNRIQTKEAYEAEQEIFLQQQKEQEIALLNAYLAQNKGDKKPSGLVVIEDVKGKGNFPKKGDVMKLKFAISSLEGEPFFSTQGESVDVEYGKEVDTKGFNEGIGYMKQGGKYRLVVPSELAFGSEGFPMAGIPPYFGMIYEVEVVEMKSKEAYEKEQAALKAAAELIAEERRLAEPAKIAKYVKDNNITVAPTESGLYMIHETEGTGKLPQSGNMVEVHYTLYNIDGEKLQSSRDSGKPFSFVIGRNQVIQGWDEGVAMMKEGGKATLLIPSAIAYGGTDRGTDIPAYSPLVFEVELISVKE